MVAPRSTGKLFFSDGASDYVCSGAAVNTPERNVVLTAGHCSSITGATGFGSPAAWPAALIDVEIGALHDGDGEQASFSKVTVSPDYLLTDGNDISILKLTKAASHAPTKVAGTGNRAIWAAGVTATIAGWGASREELIVMFERDR